MLCLHGWPTLKVRKASQELNNTSAAPAFQRKSSALHGDLVEVPDSLPYGDVPDNMNTLLVDEVTMEVAAHRFRYEVPDEQILETQEHPPALWLV